MWIDNNMDHNRDESHHCMIIRMGKNAHKGEDSLVKEAKISDSSWRFTCGDVSLFINNQMLGIFQWDWVQLTITSVTKTWTWAKNPPLLEAKPPNFRCLLREFGPIISYRNPCILCFPNENRPGKGDKIKSGR